MHKTIVVLISADVEWRQVLNLYPDVDITQTPYGDSFTLTLPQLPSVPMVHVMHGGWGKVAAAASTQWAVDTWSPYLIVNLGTCGGFRGYIERDSVVLPCQTLVYDILEQMGDQQQALSHYTTDLDNTWLQRPFPFPVVEGRLISGDRDLVAAEIEDLHAAFDAVAGDWESSSIAYVTARNGIRCLILRYVTDLVGPDGGEVYDGTLDLFESRAQLAMHMLFDHLPAWLRCAGL
ncbi:MAG: hypothetical protein P1S60_09450 [Anaerolineae bacterium]|nr:hypothetical protein [Anaerolineae bacterium]